jgi:hypothetical protein
LLTMGNFGIKPIRFVGEGNVIFKEHAPCSECCNQEQEAQ